MGFESPYRQSGVLVKGMKKIKTLFERVIVDHEIVDILPNVTEGCEWVLNGEGIATRKYDGTACMVRNGVLYARYGYYTIKRGRKKARVLPEGAIPCQDAPDPITGHFPHWVPTKGRDMNYNWHNIAFEKQPGLPDGTYELVGVHFKRNPEGIEDGDILIRHGDTVLEDVPRTFEGIKNYLESHYMEGIVFHRGNGDMCKIKRTDFHFMWNGSYSSR